LHAAASPSKIYPFPAADQRQDTTFFVLLFLSADNDHMGLDLVVAEDGSPAVTPPVHRFCNAYRAGTLAGASDFLGLAKYWLFREVLRFRRNLL
jgi:hypothetical protein